MWICGFVAIEGAILRVTTNPAVQLQELQMSEAVCRLSRPRHPCPLYSCHGACQSCSFAMCTGRTLSLEFGTRVCVEQCSCRYFRSLDVTRCFRYCECFAGGKFCENCNCHGCCNNYENVSVRRTAMKTIRKRNPSAFRRMIAASSVSMVSSIGW